MARGQRLLICSQGVPHATRGASSVIFYHYVERLQREGYEILHLLLLRPQDHTAAELEDYAREMNGAGRLEVAACWADQFVQRRRGALRLDLAPCSGILQQAREFRPDASLLIDIVPAWVGREIPAARKVAWLGDLMFHVEFYHAWYACREKFSRLLKLPSVLWRCRQWQRVYQHVLAGMDSIIVSSKSSEDHLGRLGLASEYQPYPWPNHPTAPQGAVVSRHTKPSFFFMGNLVGLGSRSAFHFLLRGVYPRLVQRWGQDGFQIFIAGRTGLPDWVARELAHAPEFKYLGFVDDIDSLMVSCHASLAPIDVPVGNRTRILSAMAKGSLVIAHHSTALGNPDLVHNETCWLASDADHFAGYMALAVDHPELSSSVIAHARRSYIEHFHPDAATQRLVDELRARGARARQAA